MFKNDKLQRKREAQFQSTEGWLLVGRERVPRYIGGQPWRRSWQRTWLWGPHRTSVTTAHSAKDKYKRLAMAKHPRDVACACVKLKFQAIFKCCEGTP